MFEKNKIVKPIEMEEQVHVLLYQIAQNEGKTMDEVIDEALTKYVMKKQDEWKKKKGPTEVEDSGDK